jgi:hypothetical protein
MAARFEKISVTDPVEDRTFDLLLDLNSVVSPKHDALPAQTAKAYSRPQYGRYEIGTRVTVTCGPEDHCYTYSLGRGPDGWLYFTINPWPASKYLQLFSAIRNAWEKLDT